MRTPHATTLTWTIHEIQDETPLVRTLILRPEGACPTFIPGQYLTVLLPGHEPSEGKSYSISSIPNGESVALTVKRVGAFSNTLCDMPPESSLTTTLPYGFFYPEHPIISTLIFVAAGIGITPLISIIESLLQSGHTGDVRMFYSNQTFAEITFHDRLEELRQAYHNFSVEYFVTREHGTREGITYGRMTQHHITSHLESVTSSEFFLCGSSSFTRDFWSKLREDGIGAHQIYTEGFF